MATGVITTAQIANDSAKFITAMGAVRENDPVMKKLVQNITLPNGNGLVVNEPYVGALPAAVQLVDGEVFDSPSIASDTNVQYTVAEFGIQVIISHLSNNQVREDLYALYGKLMANSMVYAEDRGGLTQIGAFGGSIGSGTSTLVVGHITAASASIRAGLPQSGAVARTGARATGDQIDGPYYAVIHSFQLRALQAQLSGLFSGPSDGAIGATAPTMNYGLNRAGMSAEQMSWLEQHYAGATLDGVKVITDNNLSIVSNAAKGAVFAKGALRHIGFASPNDYDVRTIDGRGRRRTLSDQWGWGTAIDVGGITLNCASVLPTS